MRPTESLQVRSMLDERGELRVSLAEVVLAPPGDEEVIVRVDAAPINPSDLGQLFGLADLDSLQSSGSHGAPVLIASVPPQAMPAMALRIDEPLSAGNEGAGVVVDAGLGEFARSLLGKTVAALGGGMYTQHRCLKAEECLVLPDGTTAEQGASSFVNPLTALGFVETARRDGHTALVHTAAASNLGLMLNRLCRKDGLGLVNVVRSQAQQARLCEEGAEYVVDSTQANFAERLTDAIAATGATVAFDAVGGGPLAGQLLSAMERALVRRSSEFSRYGSTVHKQVHVYGGLQPGPIELAQDMGKAWSVSGWLVTPFLQAAGAERARELKARVAAEITTTFASSYSNQVSLRGMLDLETARRYARRATGEKFLVCPQM